MKLIVFGATGSTGRQVVEQLLAKGHEVTAVVRQPGKFEMAHDRLIVIPGDVLDPSSIMAPMVGKHAVLSALGANHRKPTTVYSEGTNNIMLAMQEAGVRRLICLSASALEIPPDTPFVPQLIIRLIVQRLFKNLYEDMQRMERNVQRSGLDWTIIRPPRLTDSPSTGEYRIAVNEPMTKAKGLTGISRADLADCMVSLLNNPASFQALIEISY
ncbi:NAD(P)-dependent oxidoreductase [Paenibacillus caui]|uniref:NAD(P)-dependent oxidoreductase n=1 Tax=Paenibacillus caui TaxID=2873927 RepID=UPI001CA7CADE|nr:SDR family oxidoreductase [Paenibacillus caui]